MANILLRAGPHVFFAVVIRRKQEECHAYNMHCYRQTFLTLHLYNEHKHPHCYGAQAQVLVRAKGSCQHDFNLNRTIVHASRLNHLCQSSVTDIGFEQNLFLVRRGRNEVSLKNPFFLKIQSILNPLKTRKQFSEKNCENEVSNGAP